MATLGQTINGFISLGDDAERHPVTTLAELAALDDAEIAEGYQDGFTGEPEPGDNRSKSYWHGWRNGAVDGGHREKDDAQAILARAYLARTNDLPNAVSHRPTPGRHSPRRTPKER